MRSRMSWPQLGVRLEIGCCVLGEGVTFVELSGVWSLSPVAAFQEGPSVAQRQLSGPGGSDPEEALPHPPRARQGLQAKEAPGCAHMGFSLQTVPAWPSWPPPPPLRSLMTPAYVFLRSVWSSCLWEGALAARVDGLFGGTDKTQHCLW